MAATSLNRQIALRLLSAEVCRVTSTPKSLVVATLTSELEYWVIREERRPLTPKSAFDR